MRLRLYVERYAVAKIEKLSNALLKRLEGTSFYSITGTDEELSLVCEEKLLPENVENLEKGWRILKFDEILAFDVVGVLSKICTLLGEDGITVFIVSTYNTNYVLVKDEHIERACVLLEMNGYEFFA